MTAAQAIASLPPDTRLSVIVGQGDLTVQQLREALEGNGPVMLTTEQASDRFGFRPEYWRNQARYMGGAVKGRHWLLPIGECEAHMEARASRRTDVFSTPTPPPSTRPKGLQKR